MRLLPSWWVGQLVRHGVNNYGRGAISVLCGIGNVRSRAASLRGRSTGMVPGKYFENIYRWHGVRLESGMRVDPIESCGVSSIPGCAVYNVVVAVVANRPAGIAYR